MLNCCWVHPQLFATTPAGVSTPREMLLHSIGHPSAGHRNLGKVTMEPINPRRHIIDINDTRRPRGSRTSIARRMCCQIRLAKPTSVNLSLGIGSQQTLAYPMGRIRKVSTLYHADAAFGSQGILTSPGWHAERSSTRRKDQADTWPLHLSSRVSDAFATAVNRPSDVRDLVPSLAQQSVI